MNIRRFFSKSSREALSMVRQQLGTEAVILSNRAIDGGTEILAMLEQDMDKLISDSPLGAAAAIKALPLPDRSPAPMTAPVAMAPAEKEEPQSLLELLTSKKRILPPESEPVQPAAKAAPRSSDMESMMQEIKSMRHVLQSQLAELSWAGMQLRNPAKSELLNHMLASGFSAGQSFLKISRLIASFSVAASITRSQSLSSA